MRQPDAHKEGSSVSFGLLLCLRGFRIRIGIRPQFLNRLSEALWIVAGHQSLQVVVVDAEILRNVSRGVHLAVIFEAVEVTGVSAPATAVSGVRTCIPSPTASWLAAVLWVAATPGVAAATIASPPVAARISAPGAVSASAAASIGIPSAVSAAASVRIAAGVASPAAARVRIAAGVAAAATGVWIAARISTAPAGVRVASASARICRAWISRSSAAATTPPLRIEVDSQTRPGQGQRPDKRRHVRQSARHRYILSHYETTSLVNGHSR
jgi:hypothetical protein